MNSFLETIPQLAAYTPSLIGLSVLCLTTTIQNFLTAPLSFVKGEQQPGMPLKGDHSLLSFRVARTYLNSTESLPAFGFALVIAIVAGASSSLVNWLAGIYTVSRIAFWVVYYSGVGKVAGGPRTMCFVVGLVSNIVLVIACLYALLV